MPEEWSGIGLTREKIIELLNRVLKKGEFVDKSLKFNKPDEPTKIFGFNRPAPYAEDYYTDDPEGELVAKEMQRQYPESFNRLSRVDVGTGKYLDSKYSPGEIGGTVQRSLMNTPIMNVRESKGFRGGQADTFDVFRHELSHVMGLPDDLNERPNAYDVGLLSYQLHKDIELPKEDDFINPSIKAKYRKR